MSYPAIDRPNRRANGAQEQLRQFAGRRIVNGGGRPCPSHKRTAPVALAAGRGDHSTGGPSTTPPTNHGNRAQALHTRPKTRACLPRPRRTARTVTTKQNPRRGHARHGVLQVRDRHGQARAAQPTTRERRARTKARRTWPACPGRLSASATSVTSSVTNRAPRLSAPSALRSGLRAATHTSWPSHGAFAPSHSPGPCSLCDQSRRGRPASAGSLRERRRRR